MLIIKLFLKIMARSKLNLLLNSFTEDDWKGYADFAKGRYSSKSELFRIYDYLRKNKKNSSIIDSSNIELAKKLKSKQSIKVFGNTISHLCGHIEAYFVWQEINVSKDTYQTFLATALAKRNVKPLFHKIIADRQKKIKVNKKYNFWKNWNSVKLDFHNYFNSMSTKIDEGEKVLRNNIANLTLFYESMLHYYAIEINNRITLTEEDWSDELHLINQQNFTHRNAEIYDLLIDLKLNKDLSTFLSLWDILQRQQIEFSSEIKYMMLIHLISFASHMSKKNISYEGPKNKDLYSWGIKNDVLLKNGSIPRRSFFNMVNFLSLEVERSKMYDFVSQNAEKVDKKNVDEILKISYAIVEFQNGNISEAEALLRNISFNDLEIAVMSKVLLLKIYYLTQSEDYDFLDRKISNFNYFIKKRKDKFSAATIASLKNFAKYIQKLADGEKGDKLIQLIKDEKFLLARLWLLETLSNNND